MENLVIQSSQGRDVTTSLIVAQVFGKEHSKVCRDIENLSCSKSFRVANFGEATFENKKTGQNHKMYQMTKDGFSFLVMGYTGDKAGNFKEMFINEFNKREMMLKSDDYILARSQEILHNRLQLAEQQLLQANERITMQDNQIKKLQPKADFADAAFNADGCVDIGQAAKILKLPFGRNTLFKKLREQGVFFAGKNEPKQRFVQAGYFILTELPPIKRDNHPDLIVMKCVCTQKGLAYINHLFGGNTSNHTLAKIK
ncbi:phage regulatory protein/antirepressor Ant [Prevotella corporis]|uniref:phage regulatory protein/antirepressor Ant n=1 Tax=Prevotella corporis TaxID=28128 RepID=UPI0023F6BA5F|nr:phage regulatory protein/antirepressor Ant [Prevotella corporis]